MGASIGGSDRLAPPRTRGYIDCIARQPGPAMSADLASDNRLFFIPDIGGFTKFVTGTEVKQSQHIVKELLELLVDANQLGLQVAEFEGDAVLFTRAGAPPPLADLLGQARRMYVDFHSHLKTFEAMRICQCGACAAPRSRTESATWV